MIAVNALKRTNSFFRFLLVGLVNTMVGLSSMFLLINLFGLSYWISTFIGNTIGASVSYFLNRSFTFNSGISAKVGIPKFIVVILFCYFLSYSVSSAVSKGVPMFSFISSDELAILFGTVLYTLTNYFAQKILVFKG